MSSLLCKGITVKAYGYLQCIEEAQSLFNQYHGAESGNGESWAGIFLHWRDRYILVVNDVRLETAPYPYQDAKLHWERRDGQWHVSV